MNGGGGGDCGGGGGGGSSSSSFSETYWHNLVAGKKTGLHYCIYVALSGYDKWGPLILSSFSCLSHYRCCLTLAGIGLVRNIGGVFVNISCY